MAKTNRHKSIVAGPVIVVVAVLCLWANEGRFDYFQAARKTIELTSPDGASPEVPVSYTAELQECRFKGRYVSEFKGYYRVSVSAEIYSWKRTEDEDGNVSWSKGWQSSLQENSRNGGLARELRSQSHGLPFYQLGDLEVQGEQLHFADDYETVPLGQLTLSDDGKALGLTQEGDRFYLRRSTAGDELGDERLAFSGIPTKNAATYFGLIRDRKGIGKQHDYKQGFISDLIQNDGMLHHLVNGNRTTALQTIKAHIRKLKWTVRLVGTAAVCFGLLILLSRFLHLIISLPLIGSLASLGVMLVSVVLGLTISLLTVASSMVYHNPWTAFIGLGLLVALVFGLLALRNVAKKNAVARLQSALDSVAPGQHYAGGSGSQLDWDSEEGIKTRYRNLVRLAMIDGKLEESENNFLVEWGRSKGLEDEIIVELFDEAKRDAENGLTATRFEDLYAMIALAMIDGYMSLKELTHITNLGEKLGMNKAQINTVVARVRKGDYESPAVA
jgi:hypothetical protein